MEQISKEGSADVSSANDEDRPAVSRGAMEALLLRVAESKDRVAFSELFAYFAPRVKGFLMRGGTTAENAEDLAQDVMVKVYQKAALFDPAKASAATWIYTIARNARIDFFRKTAKPDLDPNEPMLVPEESPRSDEICELKERERRIKDVLSKLPAEQLSVMQMHFFDDKSHAAIAESLNLPLGTVKSRLRLAFEKVRSELGDL